MDLSRIRFASRCGWLLLTLILGCAGGRSIRSPFPSPNGDMESEFVNLSVMKGTRLIVSDTSPDFPPVALVDGIRTVPEWKPKAGWELRYEGPLMRGRYFPPEQNLATSEPIEWEGLRREFRNGKMLTALGWAIFQFEMPRVVRALRIYTVDTPELSASRYGVRDLLVEFWDDATERWQPVRLETDETPKSNTVEGNTKPVIPIRFHPIRTRFIRIAFRWTNDSEKTRSFTVMGVREEYAKGIVRLTEIEVLGVPSAGDVVATVARESFPTRVPDTADGERESAPPPPEDAVNVVRAYGNAYSSRDLESLMGTIATSYHGEGEDAEAMFKRMEMIFKEFPYFLFQLKTPRLESGSDANAVVLAEYWLQLNPVLQRTTTGKMRFHLIPVREEWKIQSIQVLP